MKIHLIITMFDGVYEGVAPFATEGERDHELANLIRENIMDEDTPSDVTDEQAFEWYYDDENIDIGQGGAEYRPDEIEVPDAWLPDLGTQPNVRRT